MERPSRGECARLQDRRVVQAGHSCVIESPGGALPCACAHMHITPTVEAPPLTGSGYCGYLPLWVVPGMRECSTILGVVAIQMCGGAVLWPPGSTGSPTSSGRSRRRRGRSRPSRGRTCTRRQRTRGVVWRGRAGGGERASRAHVRSYGAPLVALGAVVLALERGAKQRDSAQFNSRDAGSSMQERTELLARLSDFNCKSLYATGIDVDMPPTCDNVVWSRYSQLKSRANRLALARYWRRDAICSVSWIGSSVAVAAGRACPGFLLRAMGIHRPSPSPFQTPFQTPVIGSIACGMDGLSCTTRGPWQPRVVQLSPSTPCAMGTMAGHDLDLDTTTRWPALEPHRALDCKVHEGQHLVTPAPE